MMMMDIQSIIQSQLNNYYSVISQQRENRIKVKNWLITIWLAYIALIGSGKITLNKNASFLILVFIVLIFWCIEGIHEGALVMDQNRAKKLEKLLSNSTLPSEVPVDLFYNTGYSTILLKQKIKAFFIACFTAETIVVFHLAMLIASFLVVYFVEFPALINNKAGTLLP